MRVDEKFEKLVEVVMEKKGVSKEEAEKVVRFMIEKARKIKEEVVGLDVVKAIVFSGRVVDKFANVIREIDRELSEKGEEKLIFSNKIKIEGGRVYHIDYRQYIGDRENRYYGRVIEELSEDERYTTNIIGVVEVEGKWELFSFVVRGRHNLEGGRWYEFVGRLRGDVFVCVDVRDGE